MLALLGTVAASLLPLVALLARTYVERKQAEQKVLAPIERQGDVDAELATDKRAFSVRLSRLHEAVRRYRLSAKRSGPPPGV